MRTKIVNNIGFFASSARPSWGFTMWAINSQLPLILSDTTRFSRTFPQTSVLENQPYPWTSCTQLQIRVGFSSVSIYFFIPATFTRFYAYLGVFLPPHAIQLLSARTLPPTSSTSPITILEYSVMMNWYWRLSLVFKCNCRSPTIIYCCSYDGRPIDLARAQVRKDKIHNGTKFGHLASGSRHIHTGIITNIISIQERGIKHMYDKKYGGILGGV